MYQWYVWHLGKQTIAGWKMVTWLKMFFLWKTVAFQPVLFVCRRLCLLDTGTFPSKIPKNFEIPSQMMVLLRMLQPLPLNQTNKQNATQGRSHPTLFRWGCRMLDQSCAIISEIWKQVGKKWWSKKHHGVWFACMSRKWYLDEPHISKAI